MCLDNSYKTACYFVNGLLSIIAKEYLKVTLKDVNAFNILWIRSTVETNSTHFTDFFQSVIERIENFIVI